MELATKTCRRCAEVKPLTEYYAEGGACKVCMRLSQREYRASAQGREARKAYVEKNTEKVREGLRRSRAKRVAETSEQRKAYKQRNKDVIAAYGKEYRQRPRSRELANQVQQATRDALPDYYVRMLLCRGTPITSKDIPQSLVEVKRLQMQILRMAKNEKC